MSFPATFNISYYKGDFYQFVVRPKDSSGDNFPISDTSHNAYFYISSSRGGDSSATIEASAVIDGSSVVATILPTVGNQLNQSTTYFYDVSVEKKENNSELYTLLTGTISVTADITRPGS